MNVGDGIVQQSLCKLPVSALPGFGSVIQGFEVLPRDRETGHWRHGLDLVLCAAAFGKGGIVCGESAGFAQPDGELVV